MLASAPALRTFSLQRWLGLPAARARCVGHFLGIAVTLAAAKVLLSTIGVTLFVAEQGAAGLPPFYAAFAAVAILLSFGLSSIIDRVPKVRLAQIVFVGLLVGTAALRVPLALEVPGVSFALLASATAAEIIFDILFWVVVAAYLDGFEFKRATPLVYMALALGGAAGGVVARVGAGALAPADLLLLLPPMAALVVVQFAVVASRLREVPEAHPDSVDDEDVTLGPIALGRLLRRYPLALLIALNALVVTLLYGISEFLILSIYEARFASEAELAEFLSLLFAFMQVVEFALLYSLTRLLLERTGPLLRNLVFPLLSLGGLIFLVLSPRLLAAVVVHVNIEAVSNAVFLPIGNANYVPLRLGIQGRVRTLSEGIFYPIGLALAGAVLWSADPEAGVLQVEFAALVFAGLFVLLGAGAGLLFLPTLHANVGSTLIRPGKTTDVAMPARYVRVLLESPEPELRLAGLALARQLGPHGLEDDLLALAAYPDRAIRAALARLIAAAPALWAQDFLDRCLAGASEEQLKLALVVMLIRKMRAKPEQMGRVLGARDLAVVALGHAVAGGVDAAPNIQPLVRSTRVSSDLVDALVSAERADFALLLLACLPTAEPEQQRRALILLNGSAASSRAATMGITQRLAKHGDPTVRAEAIVLLSRTSSRVAAVRQLIAALDDPDGRVRHRVAEALCSYGDRATALLRPQLGALTIVSLEAVWVLARIGSPGARRVLAGYVRKLQQEANRSSRLLEWIAASSDRASWSMLELCLRDHQACMVDVVLAALAPAIELRLARQLRAALRGSDQRRRASAFELIAAVQASRLPSGAVELLRDLLFGNGADARGASRLDGPETVRTQALASMSPWVRRAVAFSPARSSLPPPVMQSAGAAGSASRNGAGDRDMAMDQQEFERIIALKRMPLFRYVPFDTIAEVARSLQARTYLAGEEVVADGALRQDLLILEAGALTIAHHDGTQTLAAPACFGEVALCGERMFWPRITAFEEARVSFLRAAIFEELCREHPEIAIELCRLLARRLQGVDAAAAGSLD